jgi:predicted metal-dependent RNase
MRIEGRVVEIGLLEEHGRPGFVLHTSNGQYITVIGLTEAQTKEALPMFCEEATLVLEAA